jgi:hypothetical protein
MQIPPLSSSPRSSTCPFSSPPTSPRYDYLAVDLPVPKVRHVVDISYPESYMRTPLFPACKQATSTIEAWDYGVEFVDEADVVLQSIEFDRAGLDRAMLKRGYEEEEEEEEYDGEVVSGKKRRKSD